MRGVEPIAVVATAGTTGVGGIDPLAEIAACCERHGLWFHVDACYGGGALLLDELRERFLGMERADSVALDLHKWFFAPLTASLLLVRDEPSQLAAFDINASYIPHRDPRDAFRRGIPTSRRATSLTLWLALVAHGWRSIREAVRKNIQLSRFLETEIKRRGFHVLPDGELSVACARWEPQGFSAGALDRLQDTIAADIVASGRAWFATVRHADKIWMRFNMVNLYTEEHHVRELVEIIVQTARRLTSSTTGTT